MRNHHDAVLNVATCALVYFGNPLSLNTVCRCIIQDMPLESLLCKEKSMHHLRWSKRQWKCVLCAVFRWIHVSACLKLTLSSQSQRWKGPFRFGANIGHGSRVHQCKRHVCEGTIECFGIVSGEIG